MNINLHNKKFKAIDTSVNGDVSSDTLFHYRQEKDTIWATYSGGAIEFGTLIGKVRGNKITLMYQQLNRKGEFLTGYCDTIISTENGKIYLSEQWRWTCKDYSTGHSLLREL